MKLALLALPLILFVAACAGSDSDDSSKPEDSSSASSSPSQSPTFTEEPAAVDSSEDPHAPNLGDRALKVGQTRDGLLIDTTLNEVRLSMPQMQYRDPADGNVFLGLRLEQCLDDSADTTSEYLSSHNGEFAAVTPSGNEYSGSGSYWDDWPSPKFPESVGLIPGRCVKGWIALEVPQGTKVQSILYRSSGIPAAEWIPKR